MNAHMIFGLFALYVAVMSLCLVLIGQQDAVLALLRRIWGRTLGHSLYFIARVALPMLICVLCFGWGVRHYDAAALHHQEATPQLNVEYYRDLLQTSIREKTPDSVGVVYGA